MADNLVNNPDPKNTYGCKFSIQYCTAASIRYGKVGVDEFGPEKIDDAELRRLMANTEVVVDAALDADFRKNAERWSVYLTLTDKAGREYRHFVEYPLGDPQNPVSYAETEEKVRTLAGTVLPERQLAELLQIIGTLESLQDASGVFDFLVAKDK